MFRFAVAADRICPGSSTQALVVNMGIDLGSIQTFVSQHLLQRAHIYAVLKHQGGSGMAQLVRGVALGIQSGGSSRFF